MFGKKNQMNIWPPQGKTSGIVIEYKNKSKVH